MKEFRQLQGLPEDVKLPPNISADLQCEQKAVWHKSCYLNFATSKLDKVRNCKLKRRDYDIYNDHSDKPRKSRRLAQEKHSTDACIFCNQERGDLRQVQTGDVDSNVRQMAVEMQDADVIAKICLGDRIVHYPSCILISI